MSEADELKLPSGWTLTPVANLLKFKNGLNKGKAYFGYGTPIVNYMDVFKHTGLRRADVHGLVDVTNAEKQAFSARKGDVLFTRTSETPEEVGISTVLLEDIENAVFSGFVLRGRPVNNLLTPEFAQYCFDSRFVRGQIVSSATYTTRALTNGRILSNVKLPLPDDIREQQAIAAALSDADGVVAGLERVIAKKRLIKQGAMQDLLTARRRLPGFSGEWEEATISDAAHVDPEALGAGTPKDYAFRYISLEDVNQGVLSGWSDVAFGSAPSRARRILQKDDVLLGTVRPNLKSHMLFDRLGADWVGSTGFAVLRPRPEKCIPGYLFELIMSDVIGRQIDEVIAGSNYPAISNSDVRKLKLMLPAIEEQKAISYVLRDMETEIQTLESRLTKARAVKEGMMQNLLTGRVRLV